MESTKETVILVHGTWAAPINGTTAWYQPTVLGSDGQTLASTLDRALEKRGAAARCWAHTGNGNDVFCWSGGNEWIDRARAASALAQIVNRLHADGWRVHIVAHSHGGNIAAEALPQIEDMSGNTAGISGTLTTLGTPFVDAMSPIARAIAVRKFISLAFAWITYIAFLAFTVMIALDTIPGPFQVSAYGLVGCVAVAGLIAGSRRRVDKGWITYWRALSASTARRKFMLVISSCVDEAWQLLHHVTHIKDPLAPKDGLLRHVLSCRREYIERSCEAERIQGATIFGFVSFPYKITVTVFLITFTIVFGLILATAGELWLTTLRLQEYAVVREKPFPRTPSELEATKQAMVKEYWGGPLQLRLIATVELGGIWVFVWLGFASIASLYLPGSFYSALWSPLRWLGRQLRALMGLPRYVITYIVRRNSWSMLQAYAVGLQSYRYDLPHVTRVPDYAPESIYKVASLPESVEKRALLKRNEWVGRYFGDLTETFSKIVVTSADLSALMRIIENDLSLVHASYYTDKECIEQIADWIASNGAYSNLETSLRPDATSTGGGER